MARQLAKTTRGKKDPTIQELCYLAGVMDSDGCFFMGKSKIGTQRIKTPRYVFEMVVTNTSMDLMNWLVEHFGGRIAARQRVSERHKITYNWIVRHGNSLWLLNLLVPLLVVKGGQARVGIDLLGNWKTGNNGGRKTDSKEVARREACFQEMKRLNQTGPFARND